MQTWQEILIFTGNCAMLGGGWLRLEGCSDVAEKSIRGASINDLAAAAPDADDDDIGTVFLIAPWLLWLAWTWFFSNLSYLEIKIYSRLYAFKYDLSGETVSRYNNRRKFNGSTKMFYKDKNDIKFCVSIFSFFGHTKIQITKYIR